MYNNSSLPHRECFISCRSSALNRYVTPLTSFTQYVSILWFIDTTEYDISIFDINIICIRNINSIWDETICWIYFINNSSLPYCECCNSCRSSALNRYYPLYLTRINILVYRYNGKRYFDILYQYTSIWYLVVPYRHARILH